MYIRLSLLISFFCCLVLHVSAQEFTLKGVLSRRMTAERVGQVTVKDLHTQLQITSDDLGWFAIKTHVGDTLLFSKEGYTPQKIAVLNQQDLPVYLQPIIKLTEVRISGQTKQQEINAIMKDYRRQGSIYNGKPPVLSMFANPITGLSELFGKNASRARRFSNFAKGELEQAEVNKRYNLIL